ncbi:phytanoyl-CoA dioxygenase family protein [Streptomyces sp. NPDC008092]|uniref:phytanoyl-CoA dioxygenase family protein n=1 Tax=Streptomyces sp. NPDC008092 TaxID=3364808 RepID=UPI0036EEE8B6
MRLAPLSVSAAEVTRFRTFGFVHLREVQDDVAPAITDAFEEVFAEVFAEVFENPSPAGREGGAGVSRIAERSEVLQEALLAEDRCPRLARRLLGTDVVYVGSAGVRHDGAVGWQREGGHRALRLIEIVQFLEPLSARTGALRIIPGTHRRGGSWDRFAAEMADPVRFLGMEPTEVPAFTIESAPGDLVAFDPYSYHASFGGAAGRRQITTTFASVPESDEARQELSDCLAADRSGLRDSARLSGF